MSRVGARQEKVQGNCEGTEKTEEATVGRISEWLQAVVGGAMSDRSKRPFSTEALCHTELSDPMIL